MNPHPGDDTGVPGTVYVLHLEPAYRHAGHYIGWTAEGVHERLATHLRGAGSPLIRAAVAAGSNVTVAATFDGTRALERRLKRWHKTRQICPTCRAVARTR